MKLYLILVLICICIIKSHSLLAQDTSGCRVIDLGIISFSKKSHKLTQEAKRKLDSVIILIRNNPNCDLYFVSHDSDFCDKCGILSWDRVMAVYAYLSEKGISENRLQSNDLLDGNQNYINLSFVPHLEIPLGTERSKLNLRHR